VRSTLFIKIIVDYKTFKYFTLFNILFYY